MDDLTMIRFALDNVHPRSLGEGALAAFDRVLNGDALADAHSRDGRKYARLRGDGMIELHEGTSGTHLKPRTSPSTLRLADASVQQDGSLGRESLVQKQKEAAASV